MIETKTQPSSSTVQDPICGMGIDQAEAFATRTFGGETLYFCSERWVEQFDREHTGSATTGVSDTERRLRVELAVIDEDGHQGAARLQEHLARRLWTLREEVGRAFFWHARKTLHIMRSPDCPEEPGRAGGFLAPGRSRSETSPPGGWCVPASSADRDGRERRPVGQTRRHRHVPPG
jgi:YHS domain-containing protein